MTHDQKLNLLSNLRLNGGRISLGQFYQREEFADMEAAGWLEYKMAAGWPYLEITPAGHVAAWERPSASHECPVCGGKGQHLWNCSLNK